MSKVSNQNDIQYYFVVYNLNAQKIPSAMLKNCKFHSNFDISIVCIELDCEQGFRFSCLKCLRQYHKAHKHLLLENILNFQKIKDQSYGQADQCQQLQQKQSNSFQIIENTNLQYVLELKQLYLKQVECTSQMFQQIFEDLSKNEGLVEHQIIQLIKHSELSNEDLQSEHYNKQISQIVNIQNQNSSENDDIAKKKIVKFKAQLETQIENMLQSIIQFKFDLQKEKEKQVDKI
ncbi:hypothetical protein ABPG74_017422 [Tetrahymena malaccensis]